MRHRPQRWDPTSSHMRQFPSVSFWHTEHHLSELHFPPATASIQNQHCYFGEIVACHTQKERVFYLFIFFLFMLLLLLLTLAAEWNFKGRLGHHSQWFFFPRCLALWETQKYGDKVKMPIIASAFTLSDPSLSSKVDTHSWTSEKRSARAGVKSAGKGHQALITASHWPWEEKKLFFCSHRNKHAH